MKQHSPSRTYVAIMNTANFDSYYCRKFVLPLTRPGQTTELSVSNTIEAATWFYLNMIDSIGCVVMVITFEDYSNLKEVSHTNATMTGLPLEEAAPHMD